MSDLKTTKNYLLFKYLNDEHGLICTESELDEIISLSKDNEKLDKALMLCKEIREIYAGRDGYVCETPKCINEITQQFVERACEAIDKYIQHEKDAYKHHQRTWYEAQEYHLNRLSGMSDAKQALRDEFTDK